MSLTTISMGNLVRKQFQYKLNAYVGVFSSMMILQILAIVFSINPSSMWGTGSYETSINVNYYSADIVIIFTIIWAFITGILITTKAYKQDDFTFVTNRVTANLSNVLFLGNASIIGGVTAILSGFLLKVLMYFVFDYSHIVDIGSGPSLQDFFVGLVATILIIFLFSSLGYLIGTLVQINRVLVVIIPVLFFGFTIMAEVSAGVYPLISIGEFYFQEPSFWQFLAKVIVTVAILFSGAVMMSNRMEVRR